MAKSLVIVESPAKAKTINKFLGSEYIVKACLGHVIDLPRKKFGVDVEKDFKPEYTIIPGKEKAVKELKREAGKSEGIYLAPDPDREGEAISWHLSRILGKKKIYRVIFNEITRKAVREAFKNPGGIDLNKVNAQQARRILDRIVGYKLSPLLWKKVGGGLSAGRVQSVALRLICDREKEIKAFVPEEYWSIAAKLATLSNFSFLAKLEKVQDKKVKLENEKQAKKIVSELEKEDFIVGSVKERKKKRNPLPPFTTSFMQQTAVNRLHFSAKKTMRIAQDLYEGIDLGGEERVGLITYMRTDSVRISGEALAETRKYIEKEFGKDFLPPQANRYKSKKGAQEAHEAVRPTSPKREPDKIKNFLSEDQYKLYELIWKRFLASQMNPAIISTISVDINAGKCLFRAVSSLILFAGFTVLYPISEEKEPPLPKLSPPEKLNLLELIPKQHFTEPPPYYTEGSLIKALEEKGIGRPSTYAPVIDTIQMRGYVRKEKGKLYPSEIGMLITDLLVKHFPQILDVEFTAGMESQLDEIERGKENWVEVLKEFYHPFMKDLDRAYERMKNLKKELEVTSEVCEECGKKMLAKMGRRGKFLGCSGYPECKNTKPLPIGMKCPQEGCEGELVERRSRKGQIFYGCTKYPECKFATKSLGSLSVLLREKEDKKGDRILLEKGAGKTKNAEAH